MNHTEKQDVSFHTEMGVTCCGVCSHVCFPLCCILLLKQTLALPRTPIDVLPKNNSPESVLISKAATFGTFKINFSFLYSVWVMLGDKACSQRQQRTRDRLSLSEWAIFTSWSLPKAPREPCQYIVWEHKSCCVWLYICTTKSVVMCVCMSFHTKPHVSHVESDFLTASLCGRICGKVRAWSQKREDVFNSRPAIIAVHALDSCTCLWVSNYTKCVCIHAILSNIPLPRCSCKMNARFHLVFNHAGIPVGIHVVNGCVNLVFTGQCLISHFL